MGVFWRKGVPVLYPPGKLGSMAMGDDTTPDIFPGMLGWSGRSPCLGCGEPIRATRDPHVAIGGRRDGTSLLVIGAEPHKVLTEEDFPTGELFLLGVAHQNCLELARLRLRAGAITLPAVLPLLKAEPLDELPIRFHEPPTGAICALCGLESPSMTDEHVWPKWFSRLLRSRSEDDRPFSIIGEDRHTRIIDVTAAVCGPCNNQWLSTLENDCSAILRPFVLGGRAQLRVPQQQILSAWAVKTTLMLDLATNQPIIPLGFYRDFGLRRKPHPNMRVFVAGYLGRSPARAQRESLWAGGISTNEPPNAFAATISIGAVVFQVAGHFVVDGTFQDGRHQFVESTRQIWPDLFDSIAWPPGNRVLDDEGFDNFASSFSDRPSETKE